MTDPGPDIDDRHPADVVTGMVDHVLRLAQTWPNWDGRPAETPADGEPPRTYTPHKAIRRVADHFLDHLAELEAHRPGPVRRLMPTGHRRGLPGRNGHA